MYTVGALYLIEILHQTTTYRLLGHLSLRCILSKFYIKPQLFMDTRPNPIVVSYRNSTSNHNVWRRAQKRRKVVSYRNSTSNHNGYAESYVLLSLYLIEILHQTTTFINHEETGNMLYLIEILHQTTTLVFVLMAFCSCILSKFYIKPQRACIHEKRPRSCILSKFYIKPQLKTALK